MNTLNISNAKNLSNINNKRDRGNPLEHGEADSATKGLLWNILLDIAEPRPLPAQVVCREGWERRAALEEFVASVAHQINNPLAVISGIAQLLVSHPDSAVREEAATIYEMTGRVSQAVDTLVRFAKDAKQGEGQ